MKTRSRNLLAGFTLLILVLSSFGFAKEGSADDLTLDQAQERIGYGFWFDETDVRWQEFKPTLSTLSQVDLYIAKNGRPGNMRVAVKDSEKNVIWETTVSPGFIPASGWVEIVVAPSVPLTPEQSYYIYVSSDTDSLSPDHRYTWRGQENSDYARGISSVEEWWPRFDFAFRTWGDTSEFARTCFIHRDRSPDSIAAAESFKTLLVANGCPTTLITMSQVTGADFSMYDLIIVASDTGFNYEWGNPASVDAIEDAQKPVLGLGYGGACLFEQLDLSINWGHGWNGSERDMYVVDQGHAVFNEPYSVAVPQDGIIELYTSTGHIGENGSDLAPEVVLLGRETQDARHYTLVQEGPHLLWGYTASPDDMKQTGKAMFINVVHHAVPVPVAALYLSLGIEDGLEGVTVNKVAGDTAGPSDHTSVEVVARLMSFGSMAKDDVPVVLTIPGNLFGSPSHTWVRNNAGGALTPTGYDDLGGGKYRVTTDLSPMIFARNSTLFYRKQIVWRFIIPNDVSPQNVTVTAEVEMPCTDPSGSATIGIMAPGSPHSLMVVNRSLLYENYNDFQVGNLLQRLYTEAQGFPASHTPRGGVYYVDRHSTAAENWDNTNVNYTDETTANVVADEIDDLIEDWHDDATEYSSIYIPVFGTIHLPVSSPKFLLIVGDDDTIPFYRYDDPSNDEGIDNISWCPNGWCVDSATNPAIVATDEDFFLRTTPMPISGAAPIGRREILSCMWAAWSARLQPTC